MRMLMLGDARPPHLSRWARHFRERGDEVLVVTADGGEADVHLRMPIGWPALGYPMLVPVLRRLCSEWRPDLVVSHYLPNYGLMTVMSRQRPHVVVGWGSDLLVLPRRNMLQRSRLSYVARRAQAFLVDAQMLVEPLVRLGAPVERVFVCPFGVDDDVLSLGASRRVSSRAPVILSTRRMERQYRIDILLQALAPISSAFRACLANDGGQRNTLRQACSRLGLDDRVEFTGFLDRARYLSSLDGADVYVSTSPSDSTSVSLLEAMAAGLACLVPDIPGNREWITEGRNGILYPPLNSSELTASLTSLLSDPARAMLLGKGAKETVRSRGRWRHTVRRAEILFAELTSARSCPTS